MNGWMRDSATALRALAEERAVLEATEMVSDRLDDRRISRTELAGRLGISRSEVTQRLSGKRNLSVKTLAAMLHEMGYQLCLGTRDLADRSAELRPFHAAPQPSWTSHEGATKYTPTGASLRLVSAQPAA
jgi:transcriptional regulator with XRE-family HTH domain